MDWRLATHTEKPSPISRGPAGTSQGNHTLSEGGLLTMRRLSTRRLITKIFFSSSGLFGKIWGKFDFEIAGGDTGRHRIAIGGYYDQYSHVFSSERDPLAAARRRSSVLSSHFKI